MKRGDLLRLSVLDHGSTHTDHVYPTEVGKNHGYLWIFVEVDEEAALWRVKSVATGYEAVFFSWKLERA